MLINLSIYFLICQKKYNNIGAYYYRLVDYWFYFRKYKEKPQFNNKSLTYTG